MADQVSKDKLANYMIDASWHNLQGIGGTDGTPVTLYYCFLTPDTPGDTELGDGESNKGTGYLLNDY